MTTAITKHPLPLIQEFHTSELTANCLRSVYHRHKGETESSMTTALYRGLLAGAALEFLHGKHLDRNLCMTAVNQAAAKVEHVAQDENRPLSDSVTANLADIHAEVFKVCEFYCGRFADPFAKCRIIGTELPIRCDIDVDGEAIHFASHLDLLFRHPDSSLVFDDFKWREETPTAQYLARNLQFAMYAYALRFGEVQTPDGEWVSFAIWPIGRWIHLPGLKPYARNGPDYKAGEHRDIDKIIRTVPFDDSSEAPILNEFAQRVRMARANFWPTNPDPVGCHICDSRMFCTQFTAGGISNENQ